MNIGAGFDIKNRDSVRLVARLCRSQGEIACDASKPEGQPRRMVNASQALREFGCNARTPFEEGLWETEEGLWETAELFARQVAETS